MLIYIYFFSNTFVCEYVHSNACTFASSLFSSHMRTHTLCIVLLLYTRGPRIVTNVMNISLSLYCTQLYANIVIYIFLLSFKHTVPYIVYKHTKLAMCGIILHVNTFNRIVCLPHCSDSLKEKRLVKRKINRFVRLSCFNDNLADFGFYYG